MTIHIDGKMLAGAVICLAALFFGLGADTPSAPSSTGPKWAICGVPDSIGDAYIINQQTGNLYYMERKHTTGSSKFKLKLLGNIGAAD